MIFGNYEELSLAFKNIKLRVAIKIYNCYTIYIYNYFLMMLVYKLQNQKREYYGIIDFERN
jgi:hypothetical protein